MKDLINESPEQALGMTYADFCEILDEIDGKRKVVDEANGALRSTIKARLDAASWHKKGLAIIRDLRAMSATQRADVLRTFKPMLDLLLERKWADELKDLAGERPVDDHDVED